MFLPDWPFGLAKATDGQEYIASKTGCRLPSRLSRQSPFPTCLGKVAERRQVGRFPAWEEAPPPLRSVTALGDGATMAAEPGPAIPPPCPARMPGTEATAAGAPEQL